MSEATFIEKSLTIKSRTIRKSLQAWLAFSVLLSSCTPVFSRNNEQPESKPDLNNSLSFYAEKGIEFNEVDVKTPNRDIHVYTANNSGVQIDPEQLAETYTFFENLSVYGLGYQIVVDGPLSQVEVVKPKMKDGAIIIVNDEDGLPDKILEEFSDYPAASANGRQFENVPALTYNANGQDFLTIIRVDGDIKHTRLLELAEACNVSTEFELNAPYLSTDAMSISAQANIAADMYCTTWANVGLNKSFGMNYTNNVLLMQNAQPPEVSIAGSPYRLNFAPIDESNYNLLPIKPYIVADKP